MAITRQGALQGNAVAGSSGGFSISMSGLSIAQNDILVIALSTAETEYNHNISASGNNSGAATELADLFVPNGESLNMWAGTARQTAVDTLVTISGSMAGTGWSYAIIQYRGQSSGASTASTATGTATGNPDPASLAPGNTKIVTLYGGTSQEAWDTPSDVSNFIQQSLGQGRLGVADKDWTSGTFNPAALTGGDEAEKDSWAAVTLGLPPALQSLTPSLFTNSQAFQAPTVIPGWVVYPPLSSNEQSFFTPIITGSLIPSLFTNDQAFYAPVIIPEQFLEPALFTNSASFPAARVALLQYVPDVGLTTNEQTFYSPTAWADTDDSAPAWTEALEYYPIS